MPDKDVTRLTVERASTIINSMRGHFKQQIPYGPKSEGLTNKEARLKIQNMDLVAKQQLQQQMGPEAWDSYMTRLYGTRS